MPSLDGRPGRLDATYRPDDSFTVNLTGPAGWLSSRAFTATLGGVALSVSENGDVLTIVASAAITAAATSPAQFVLTLTGGNDALVGTWSARTDGSAQTSTTAAVIIDSLDVAVTLSAATTATALSTLTALGLNARNRIDPLANAVADGSTHPLSERFATLAAAQAVFPRATALTEEIDRHALQLTLDDGSSVYWPAGTYIIDTTVFTDSAGNQTIRADQATLKIGDDWDRCVVLASGNVSDSFTQWANPTAAQLPALSGLTITGKLIIDGNQANAANVGNHADGVYLGHCDDLYVEHLEVKNCGGSGLTLNGVNDVNTQGITVRRIYSHDNLERGMTCRLQLRRVSYEAIRCEDNGTDGMFLDHSETCLSHGEFHGNGETGIYIRNVTGMNVSQIRATANDQHGILVSSFVDSIGSDWYSANNSQGTANTYDDIHFDGTAHARGITAGSRITNVFAGQLSNITGAQERYLLYVADGVNLDLDGLHLVNSGDTGRRRFPAGGVVRVNDEVVIRKSAIETVNNTATLQDDDELKWAVKAGEVWTFDILLRCVGASANADFKAGFSTPASSSGSFSFVANTTAATGGSGTVTLGDISIATSGSVGLFSGTYDIRINGQIALTNDGTVVLQWAQNTQTLEDTSVQLGSILRARRVAA